MQGSPYTVPRFGSVGGFPHENLPERQQQEHCHHRGRWPGRRPCVGSGCSAWTAHPGSPTGTAAQHLTAGASVRGLGRCDGRTGLTAGSGNGESAPETPSVAQPTASVQPAQLLVGVHGTVRICPEKGGREAASAGSGGQWGTRFSAGSAAGVLDAPSSLWPASGCPRRAAEHHRASRPLLPRLVPPLPPALRMRDLQPTAACRLLSAHTLLHAALFTARGTAATGEVLNATSMERRPGGQEPGTYAWRRPSGPVAWVSFSGAHGARGRPSRPSHSDPSAPGVSGFFPSRDPGESPCAGAGRRLAERMKR